MSNRLKLILLGSLALGVCGCADAGDDERSDLDLVTITAGLEHPWGMAFLPDGRVLVTERPGRLRIVERDGKAGPPIAGVPAVDAKGQGGLLDVALDPAFAKNRLVYLSYSEPREGGNGTSVARGVLEDGNLTGVQVIFRQQPAMQGGHHFGSRLVFARDGTLFVTLGERNIGRAQAQTLDNTLGKIVRINPDGTIPPDNPFVGREGRIAGDLVLWASQRPGRGTASRHRRALGERTRAQGRRRVEPRAAGAQLRMADGELRHRVHRREDQRRRDRAWH